MGYKYKRKLYKLTFEEFDGLEVTAKSLSLGELMAIMRSADVVASDGDRTSDGLAAIDDMLTRFSKALLSWNLEDEETGDPIPATRESLEDLDQEFVIRLVEAWTEAVAGVSDDLGKDSSSGETSLAGSIPMAPL